MALTVGDRLGHYDVTALIGEGGIWRPCVVIGRMIGVPFVFTAQGGSWHETSVGALGSDVASSRRNVCLRLGG